MAKHKANGKSSGRRGASSSANQQQKHSKKHSKVADLAGKVVKHRRPWDCRNQLETAFVTKIAKLPTEVGFFLTMPAANNGPVRIHSHNLTKRQSIAMVKALNRALPFPQSRLEKWIEKAAAERAKGGCKQRKVQQQRQQKKAHRPPPAQRQQQSSGGLGSLSLASQD
jgi:hypothetical protein